jgi:hypothetical protein
MLVSESLGRNRNACSFFVSRNGKAIAHLHLMEWVLRGDWDLLFDFHW